MYELFFTENNMTFLYAALFIGISNDTKLIII